MMNDLMIGFYWQSRMLSLLDAAQAVHVFQKLLEKQIPHGNKISFQSTTLDKQSQSDDWISEFCTHTISDQHRYSSYEANGKPTSHANSPLGFSFHLSNSEKRNTGLHLIGTIGAYDEFTKNSVTVKICKDICSEIIKSSPLFQVVKKTLLFGITHWNVSLGKIFSLKLSDAIDDDNFTAIGWLTYLAHLPPEQIPAKSELLGMGITWEAVPQGGTLFMLDQEMVSADNPEHVARGKLLRARLMEHGWIEN
ncbi:Imm52 family immunity protein [Massilia sp. W12]|uniref:Imm52 family immunity protein n=1 Tax=Massilia sp. W12 TaxID=3126507 RepID=UPI0030CC1722